MNVKRQIFLALGGLVAVGAYMNKNKIADIAAKLTDKWTGLDPEVKKRALVVLENAEIAFSDTPYTLHIFDGKRSIEKQLEYMGKGTSFVSNALRSYHPWGLAVDFVFKDESGNWTWEPGKDCAFYDLTCHGQNWYWDTLGEIIEAAGFEWGGRWKNVDAPHAQYVGKGRTRDLIAEYQTPENFTNA